MVHSTDDSSIRLESHYAAGQTSHGSSSLWQLEVVESIERGSRAVARRGYGKSGMELCCLMSTGFLLE